MPRPTRLRALVGALGGLEIVDLHDGLVRGAVDLFDGDEVRNPGDHAADLGTVRQDVGLADAAEPEGPQRAPLLGLGADGRPDLGDLERRHHCTSVGLGAAPRSVSLVGARAGPRA